MKPALSIGDRVVSRLGPLVGTVVDIYDGVVGVMVTIQPDATEGPASWPTTREISELSRAPVTREISTLERIAPSLLEKPKRVVSDLWIGGATHG